MKPSGPLLMGALIAALGSVWAAPQEPAIELPVQLVGFPVIIVAVRLSNFVKKLAYSLSPKTYAPRVRREAIAGPEPTALPEMIDGLEAEKRLVAEFGEHVCIYTRVCAHYAHLSSQLGEGQQAPIDWDHVLMQYKASPDKNKEFYLLSVFLGDMLGSTRLCAHLAKRGRACTDTAGHLT